MASRIGSEVRAPGTKMSSQRSSPGSKSVHPEVESKGPERKVGGVDAKLENRLNIKDLESLQEAFMAEGDGYDNRLSLNKDQFAEALFVILNKGSKEEYLELFDKIDVTKEGIVDWDKFASHMLLEFYERDDRVRSTQVPQWKDLKTLPLIHKETIQRVAYLKNTNRYCAISKEGTISMWNQELRMQRHLKTATESCKQRDLWVTHFVVLQNINKIALSFTSKEIAFYDLSSKLEFNCQYKVQGLEYTPLCLDYWYNPANINEALIAWGDVGGCVSALHFASANIALFERPPAPAGEKQEPTLNVQLSDITKGRYKNCKYTNHKGHSEWVRQVKYSANLECFLSCATNSESSLVIGWMEKNNSNSIRLPANSFLSSELARTTTFRIVQGVNAFDYHSQLNLIATAGVNHQVCLWNPYVVSKANGVLRGHMAAVVQVQFNSIRGQLISFSKDKVLRIWDVQLQVCIQRLAGMFPKGPEVMTTLFFEETKNKLFITFNCQLTVMEMKAEVRDRVLTHDKPVVAAIYNSVYNQVVTACQTGTVNVWMMDTGQKVKQFSNVHGSSEVTTLGQDITGTRLFTGSTDGSVKIWDFNGHCYHALACGGGAAVDVGQITVLKRIVLVVGWTRQITVFRNTTFRDFHVLPSDWKGGQEHTDDILAADFCPPSSLATGSYDGEIVIWNTNSEQGSKHLNQRCKRKNVKSRSRLMAREGTNVSERGEGSPERSSRPKSRAQSRVSAGSYDDNNEYGYAIARVLFLQSRKSSSAGAGANLVSCGGNGWVRFWSTAKSCLMGEFVAHLHAGSIIMGTDKDNQFLVTGDTDGMVKVWDISAYCIRESDGLVTASPPLKSQWQPHSDIINTIDICERNERLLVITASSDCSVALSDMYGNQIGVFGQEEHWKIEPYEPPSLDEQMDDEEENVLENDVEGDMEVEEDSWSPAEEATLDPENYRINSWDSTILGKDYKELRVKKRQRRQPQTIPDLPYLHWERTGAPPAGPYAALSTTHLMETSHLHKPDFMSHPHKYFSERADTAEGAPKLPSLTDSLKAAFDEKTLFPKSLLDYELRTKQQQNIILNNNMARVHGSKSKLNVSSQQRAVGSPKVGGVRNKPNKLRPIGSHKSSLKDGE